MKWYQSLIGAVKLEHFTAPGQLYGYIPSVLTTTDMSLTINRPITPPMLPNHNQIIIPKHRYYLNKAVNSPRFTQRTLDTFFVYNNR